MRTNYTLFLTKVTIDDLQEWLEIESHRHWVVNILNDVTLQAVYQDTIEITGTITPRGVLYITVNNLLVSSKYSQLLFEIFQELESQFHVYNLKK